MRYYRLLPQDAIYHITCRCNNQEHLFIETHSFEKYLEIIKDCKKKHDFKLYNYVILHNHVHLIIKPGLTADISKIMHSINRWYARWYNEYYGRKGHFWETRFDSVIIKDDYQLLATMRYVDRNPLNAGLCSENANWLYSGTAFYLNGTPNSLIDTPEIYVSLGQTDYMRRQAYASIIALSV